MAPAPVFAIIFTPQTRQHLYAIDKKYHSLIRQSIEEQLKFEPNIKTRNRKPLEDSIEFNEVWEIRFGPDNRFRVLYEINADQSEVYILAIGIKRGNRLFVGGTEIEL
jgi:mRNA-degrading endonuclease RelE of RelBE toxin-antitoxin system